MAEKTKVETPESNERKDPTSWMEKVSCDIGLRQMVDAFIAKQQEEFVHSGTPSWYPSDLGKDLFIRFIKRKGYEAIPFDARTLRKFEFGKMWELKIHQAVDWFLTAFPDDWKEIDLCPEATYPAMRKRVINDKLELRGYYDRLLLHRDPKIGWIIIVFEVKSIASRSFHHQKIEGEQPLGNRMQLMFYLERIQAPENWEKIKRICQEKYGIVPVKATGVLSQASKDDGAMWERTYDFDPVLYGEIEKEIATLNEYWKTDKLPPKPDLLVFEEGAVKVNWEISYSNYVHHILGQDYAKILLKAEQLVNRHRYYRTKNPSKVGVVEKEILDFNASLK